MDNKEQISLLELMERVKGAISREAGKQVWIRAEISDIKNHSAGHCYLELVDSESNQGDIEARAQGIIWASAYKMIRPYFETTTGYSLSVGMHILIKVLPQFSPLYGLSLIISDIDPSFTVGELEIERQKTILKLKSEGAFEMNKSLTLPGLPKKFAIISSPSAAGYLDFIKHLHENQYGYKFMTKLFPAPMQGERAAEGIIEAMDKVALESNLFDALLILRGGGSPQDLRCFDDYELAVNIAQFPLPVLTGIGHEQDFHIADMAAHTSVKTPTALAAFITGIFIAEESKIASFIGRLSLSLHTRVSLEKNRVSLLEQRAKMNNPLALLEKGYALVSKDGVKVLFKDLKKGDKIDLMMKSGTAECTVFKLK